MGGCKFSIFSAICEQGQLTSLPFTSRFKLGQLSSSIFYLQVVEFLYSSVRLSGAPISAGTQLEFCPIRVKEWKLGMKLTNTSQTIAINTSILKVKV